ncbi:unnamed protein product [Bemisia tabaci]|uniref:Protein phosphatase 1 regulatory subunit 16A n=1 Tax=Bemisia tabaci TaxID=7038 RepID=A0A9P0A119_BEMTA|nr:unnamed protein product [Bemisia tabaci]
MEHAELVNEMAHVEHMSTQDRLHLARRRRIQQLKIWAQREKEWHKTERNSHKKYDKGHQIKSGKRGITFSDNVMLLEAASRNDVAEVRRLLIKGVSPDSTNEDGLTALHQCCIDDNEEMMKVLLEFGANVNAEDSEKWTPLHAAATCGHLHLVRYLINSGANLLAVNADGNMPYDICEDESALDYIEGEMARRGVTQELIDETRASTETQMLHDLEILAKQGKDLEWYDEQGATPLHIAAANGYIRVVEFLLDQHVSTDVRDNDDWQPVHAAACWGHLEVLELLVQNGADLNAKTKHDETPADICEDSELRERILQLRTEQETKRIQEAQKRRVKRTQSNNTRTQSVRRTSIREKTLTSKKDAVEEARLRLQAHDVFIGPVDMPELVNNKVGESVTDSSKDLTLRNERDVLGRTRLSLAPDKSFQIMPSFSDTRQAPPSSDALVRREPDGKDCEKQIVENINESKTNELPTEAMYSTESNGKINIHVSVTINAGTLAELKKQRAQNRTISPDMCGTPSLSASRKSSLAGSEVGNGTAAVKRFAGNTGDNVIGDPKTRWCCILC